MHAPARRYNHSAQVQMRLFIAVNFPPAVLDDLNARVAALRPRLPSASWVKEGTQHVTLAFLGDQPDLLIDTLAHHLTEALHQLPSFSAHIQGCGFFPNPRRARVGWVGLEPQEPFMHMAHVVREIVAKDGVTLDRAEFRPHLTLMRIREVWPPASIELFSKTLRDYRSEEFDVDSITLFASELNPKGAIHTPLRRFPLEPALV